MDQGFTDTEYILIQYLRHLNGKEVVEPVTMKMSKENRDRIKELKKSTGKGNPDFWKYNHGSPDYKKSMVGMGLKKGAALKFKYPFTADTSLITSSVAISFFKLSAIITGLFLNTFANLKQGNA